MRAKFLCGVAVVTLFASLTAGAQQGHPLVGVWLGDWGPTASDRHPVVLEMTWQNTTLSGTINPGESDGAPIKVGRLDSSNWTVHLEGDAKDEKGNPMKVVVDGQIENLGSPKRSLTGTWMRGTTKGTFKLTRE
jgi:hypothetical protein